ncbi:hypothetical protein BDA99DRAFT_534105 [Phascolomyces articulosus]|uniref:Uncharacterized protein n=1 Tax=Phascolomyces articulosus TaxID=60185 RepID=A0AAD5PH01_9FUNG|nr:hypothetical protein BDA99DRAFT_534105 [Phascolomyces articulosus]
MEDIEGGEAMEDVQGEEQSEEDLDYDKLPLCVVKLFGNLSMTDYGIDIRKKKGFRMDLEVDPIHLTNCMSWMLITYLVIRFHVFSPCTFTCSVSISAKALVFGYNRALLSVMIYTTTPMDFCFLILSSILVER